MKKLLRCSLVAVFALVLASCSWGMTITSPIREGKVGEEYGSGFTINGAYSAARVVFYISSGSLPPGIEMKDNPPYSALLQGIPTKIGVYPFEVTAIARSETYKVIATATANYTITISKNPDIPEPEIVGIFPDGVKDKEYSYTIKQSKGTAPFKWEKTSGNLPIGLSLKGIDSEDVTLEGTPLEIGEYTFDLTLTDKYYGTYTKSFTVKITDGSTSDSNTKDDDTDTVEEKTNDDDKTTGTGTDKASSSGSGGGCETGLGIFALMIVGAGLIRKFR